MIMIVGMILQLDFCYIIRFKKHYKMIAIDLGKQLELAALKVIQRNDFGFFTRKCESMVNIFCFDIISIQNELR